MTIKELVERLSGYSPDAIVRILEGKKHEDDAPVMDIIDIEFVYEDDCEYAMITIEPNPETVIKSLSNNEPNAQASVATGDAILMNDDNKKPNPVKEGKGLYSKEDMEKAYEEGRLYGEWAENNYHIGDINKKNPYKTIDEHLSSPEFKNNQL